ncbi:hypothetical protein CJU89_0927 [Yarrowia sp. B02]|nr:hypothetical protein CJU89_0927 [Yarrowia sp. B02]
MTTDEACDLEGLLESLSRLEIEAAHEDDAVCDTDELFVSLLQLVDDYERLTSQMCEQLKKGHLDVAKANYDNFMAASTFNSRISRSSYDERPRRAQITVLHRGEFTIEEKKEGKKEGKDDPIRMFGIMPPYTLRTAQEHFRHAVDTMVELVNVKSRLRVLEGKIEPVTTKEPVDIEKKEDTEETTVNAEDTKKAAA